MYLTESIQKYLDDLSARLPAPGGGSAAALTGALGASLICMVLNFTVGKEKYKKFEKELNQAQKAAEELKKKLIQLIDRDVEAYTKVSQTFNSKDNTIKEKTLKDAVGVPIEICNCSYEALKLSQKIIKKTNMNLVTDMGVAAEFLEAAYNSALFNIQVNLKGIKDKIFSDNILKVIGPQIKEVIKLKDKIIKFTDKEVK